LKNFIEKLLIYKLALEIEMSPDAQPSNSIFNNREDWQIKSNKNSVVEEIKC